MNGQKAKVTSFPGFLSGSVSTNQRAGTSYCPWLLEASPGQRINITLYNFQLDQMSGSHDCRQGATVRDDGHSQNLMFCSGEGRTKTYTSQTNVLEVELNSAGPPAEFLLYYKGTLIVCALAVFRHVERQYPTVKCNAKSMSN